MLSSRFYVDKGRHSGMLHVPVEFLQNPNVSEGDPATVAIIPSFISSVVSDLDTFAYDASAGTATTTVNVTNILVSNKSSEEVLPFN